MDRQFCHMSACAAANCAEGAFSCMHMVLIILDTVLVSIFAILNSLLLYKEPERLMAVTAS